MVPNAVAIAKSAYPLEGDGCKSQSKYELIIKTKSTTINLVQGPFGEFRVTERVLIGQIVECGVLRLSIYLYDRREKSCTTRISSQTRKRFVGV
jgi:hypothetical protein